MTLRTFKAYIIEPKEATNLVLNPSFEYDTTGYTAEGAAVSIAQVATYQRRGAYSCEITTATGVVSGLHYQAIAMTSGTTYNFSADVLDVASQGFNMFISSSTAAANVCSTATEWTGNGYWKRRCVTYSATATANFYVFITRDAVASTTKFYVDGLQVESGSESTYFDGDMTGFVPGELAYWWSGKTYRPKTGSLSYRSGQTRSGGTRLDIGSYARILAIQGLGMASLTNIAIPSTMGGSYYQNTVPNERAFSLVVNFNGAGDYAEIERDRAALIDALKPDRTRYRQPLLLQIDQLDANGMECAETLMIPCLYEGGLEMDGSGDSYNEKAALTFRQYLPLIQQDGNSGTALDGTQDIANANYIVYQDDDGLWHNIAATFDGNVYAIAKGTDGKIYIGGSFTSSDGNYITTWNGSTLTAFSTSDEPNGAVYALAVAPDGKLYAGGNFTAITGSSVGDRIAVWDGSAWAALGNGLNNTVYSIAIGQNSYIYAGGTFTAAAGTSDSNYISVWNGAAWAALGIGVDGAIKSIVIDKNNNLYAGGSMSNAGGLSVGSIAKWDGTAWSALGTGVAGGSAVVNSVCLDGVSNLYITGSFTSVNGVSVSGGVAKWNGFQWYPLPVGLTGKGSYLTAINNNVYINGSITIGGVVATDRTAVWNGSTWLPLDIDLPGDATVYSVFKDDATGNLYLGYNTAGTATAPLPATVTPSNDGSAAVYPKVFFTGPGTVSQLSNYTTKQVIYFDVTLAAGETALLDLDPQNVSFVSSWRGQFMQTILPGSDMDFHLIPGANSVSCFFFTGSTTASEIVMVWKDQYWSIDGAMRA